MEKIEQLIGKKVKAARLAAKMSQTDLATNAKTSLTTINRLENGKQAPHSSTLEEICKVLGLTPAELYNDNVLTAVSRPMTSDRAELILKIQSELVGLNMDQLVDLADALEMIKSQPNLDKIDLDEIAKKTK